MIRTPLVTKRPRGQSIDEARALIAPIRGWNSRDPEAAMKEGDAIYLDNWWATPTDIQIRKGAADHCTGIGAMVQTLIPFQGKAGTAKLFACTDSGIHDATASGTSAGVVQALTEGDVRYVSFATSGNSYVVLVNGTDNLLHYEGTTWTSVASFAISGGGTLNTNTITALNAFKRRLFFIPKNSTDFYYLPIDSISGSVTLFPLGALMTKGGYLAAMGTWTIDSGEGADDYAVFVTSEGQAIVYAGTDPSNASAWALKGVYDIGKPLGKKCLLKYGGDLLYLSDGGLLPLSKALVASPGQRSALAVTDRISKSFTAVANNYGIHHGWQVVFSLSESLLLVNIPTATANASAVQFVMNTESGAWASISGWNAACFELLGKQLYMGMDGKVATAWSGASDFDAPITAIAKSAFNYLSTRGRLKHPRQLRPLLRRSGTVSVGVAVDMDFEDQYNFGAASFSPASGSLWNQALWNQGIWAATPQPKAEWLTVAARPGYCAAIRLRVIAKDATVQWFSTDMLFEQGAIR